MRKSIITKPGLALVGGALLGLGAPLAAAAPGAAREVHVEQIGDRNTANITQTAHTARATVQQSGAMNRTDLVQSGSGSALYFGKQQGEAHIASVTQDGAGANILGSFQSGAGNRMTVMQDAVLGAQNEAQLSQVGSGNAIDLKQSGRDNEAQLSQEGANNAMSVVQTGADNQLSWSQTGSSLSGLSIVQEGGGRLMIAQTGPGH